MKMGWAQALLVAIAATAACGKGGSSSTGDAGLHGPTNLVAKWTFTGKAADASGCMAHGASQVYVNLSGTVDPSLHKSATVDCAKGTFSFGSPLVEDLGMPYLEATLLDDKGVSVDMGIVGVNVTPALGNTTVTLDFFPAMNTGGAGGMGTTSSTSASSTTASSSGSMGGAGGTGGTSGTGGAGGAATSGSGGASGVGGADAG